MSVRRTMDDSNKRIRKFKSYSVISRIISGIAVCILLIAICYVLYGLTPKSTREINVEVADFRVIESDTGADILAVFKTENGLVGMATLPRGLMLQKGDAIVCIESITNFGSVKYRFLRKI